MTDLDGEYDRENIRERTQAGMHRAFRNGKHGGRIPYGYDVVDESGTFEVVEHEPTSCAKS